MAGKGRLQGWKRKIVYVGLYEAIAIVASSTGLSFGADSQLEYAGAAAVTASVIAVIWNIIFNTVFEFVEARLRIRGRGLADRVVHALCFEGGLVFILAPVFAWWLDISLAHALMLDLGLAMFFVIYTFSYNWIFDRVFGLPASVA
ncbi:MAG TPA: PACE efflux transporter [Nevskiaceae bacterium]